MEAPNLAKGRHWDTSPKEPLCPHCGAPKLYRLAWTKHGDAWKRINAYYCADCKCIMRFKEVADVNRVIGR